MRVAASRRSVSEYPELVKGLMLAWPSGGDYAAERLPKNFYRQYIRAALRQGMAGVIEIDRFAASIAQKEANRTRLLAMDAQEFARQMAYWAAFFDTSGDLPIAGCRATEQEWASIEVPAIVGRRRRSDSSDRDRAKAASAAAELLLSRAGVTADEWSGLFNVVPFPQVSDFQGARIAQCGGISSSDWNRD